MESVLDQPPVKSAPAKPQVASRKAASWRDFPVEEHIRAHLVVAPKLHFKAVKIADNFFRVNITDPAAQKIDSCLVRVTEEAEGYKIEKV